MSVDPRGDLDVSVQGAGQAATGPDPHPSGDDKPSRHRSVSALTRTIRGVASEVVVGEECGLKERAAVNLHHLFTIPKSGLHRFVGSVSEPSMRAVRRALLYALAFES